MSKVRLLFRSACLSLAVLVALAGSNLAGGGLSLAQAASPGQRGERGSDTAKAPWRAVVQLGPVALVKNKKGKQELRYFGWGSGTVLTRDGLILTNYHVVDVSGLAEEIKGQKNVQLLENTMVVLFTRQTDQPPVAMFIAEVVDALPNLDLALVRIRSDLSGNEIDPDSLDLPFIELGDSDTVEIEDVLRIYGYPSIGGNTITFTRGNVSGFDTEEGVEGRAWIKTDATISGGNSGGTALNDAGQLVGVPTQAAVSSAERITDCRRVQDTNGDGRIDETDTCIPIGGFINALRPVNLAREMIARAIDGESPNPDEPDGPASDGVQIVGTIVDAHTGKPIPGAVFVVLQAGLTWSEFSGSEDEVLEAVKTDRQGRFEMTELLERGKTYSVGWAAKGYREVTQDNLKVTNETPDVVEATLKLQKR
ncbi:MAG: serine protease [Anaerolineae bacterium]|nr:serine protease [Thermoflexales bacterium]MDW8406241.1 serine protease [Anaerolineae bacterium]